MAKKRKKSVQSSVKELKSAAKKLHNKLKSLDEKLPHGYTIDRRKKR